VLTAIATIMVRLMCSANSYFDNNDNKGVVCRQC
jgi:hypothetical protein